MEFVLIRLAHLFGFRVLLTQRSRQWCPHCRHGDGNSDIRFSVQGFRKLIGLRGLGALRGDFGALEARRLEGEGLGFRDLGFRV